MMRDGALSGAPRRRNNGVGGVVAFNAGLHYYDEPSYRAVVRTALEVRRVEGGRRVCRARRARGMMRDDAG